VDDVNEATDHPAPALRKVTLFLSGGGYRAALGSLGAMYFVLSSGRWSNLARVVSVSGGGIVNARLAVRRPSETDAAAEFSTLFRLLTSRRRTWLGVSIAVLPPALLAAAALAFLGELRWVLALVAIVVVLPFSLRLWLTWLYRGFVGKATFKDLETTTWNVEHTFVASDLGSSGSFVMSCNRVQPILYSVRRGYFDGRGTTFKQALRASTALPPVLPPLRLRLRPSPPRAVRSSLGYREWLWEPAVGLRRAIWLVDGGVTGNLGSQLDPRISPDNLTLVDVANAKVQRGMVPDNANCAFHDELAWMCLQCEGRTLIVDSSGLPPPASRWGSVLLRVPGIWTVYNLSRTMRVMYEASLTDDQANAGEHLVSVVRTDMMAQEFARRHSPLTNSSNSRVRMMDAGGFESGQKTPP